MSTSGDRSEPVGSGPTDAGPDDRTLVVGDVEPVAEGETGRKIGRYVALEEAGRGAMGRVLRAYDPKLQREVALKELQWRALDDEDARATLVAEARAMAKLSHPNVVSVFDVEPIPNGEGERLVLVMEYVAGATMSDWLAGAKRPWQEILERFVQAGRGLSAAHQAGLLHRDFKPANVMVGMGEAKVTDFGLATPGAAKDGAAENGADEDDVVMGTPRYMAPEQHLGRRDIGPACDQYAFCVALWEALCGAAPFSGRASAEAKLEGPPPWPRSDVPRWLSSAVVRGLAPEPAHRFASMDALLSALTAGPARVRARRRVLGASVVGVGLLALSTLTTQGEPPCRGARAKLAGAWDDERRERVEQAIRATEAAWSDAAWERVSATLDQYADDWVAMHTDACEATSVRKEQSAAALDLRMACLQRRRTQLAAVTDVLGSADIDVVERVEDLLSGIPPLERCADIEALQEGVELPSSEEADAVDEVRAKLARAKAERTAGRYDAARRAAEEAESMAQNVSYGPLKTEVEYEMGEVLDALGEFEASTRRLERAVALAAEHRQFGLLQSASSRLMMILGYRLQRPDEALRYRSLVEGLAKGDTLREATLHLMLGSIYMGQGRYPEAEAEFRRALELEQTVRNGPHARIADLRSNIAMALSAQGKYDQAETEQREATKIFEATLGPEHPDVATIRNNLAGTLLAQGRFEEAAEVYRASLAHRRRLLGDGHRLVAQSQSNLATALRELGEYAEAEALQRTSLETLKRNFGPDDPDVTVGLTGLAITLNAKGKDAEAAEVFAEIVERNEAQHGPEHPDVGRSRTNLGTILRVLGRLEQAQEQQDRALAIFETSLGPEHPLVATVLFEQARIAEANDDANAAEALVARALEIRRSVLGPEHPQTLATGASLAKLRNGGRLEDED